MPNSFWILNEDLTETHINGNPNMPDETLELLMQMSEFALEALRREEEAREDDSA